MLTAAEYIQHLQSEYRVARTYQDKFAIGEELAMMITVLDYLERCYNR